MEKKKFLDLEELGRGYLDYGAKKGCAFLNLEGTRRRMKRTAPIEE